MNNFDVQIVSKDFINGDPIAICKVTHDNLYYSTVKYHYLYNRCETIDITDLSDIFEWFNISSFKEFIPIAMEVNSKVRNAIFNATIQS